jgi:hypothetical protein
MPNATVRANARAMPESTPQPGDPSALAQATVELDAAADDLRGVRVLDLERDIRNLHHLAQIVAEWAEEQNFYHPDRPPMTTRTGNGVIKPIA